MTPDEIDAKLVKTNLTEELLMLPLQSREPAELLVTVPRQLKGLPLKSESIIPRCVVKTTDADDEHTHV